MASTVSATRADRRDGYILSTVHPQLPASAQSHALIGQVVTVFMADGPLGWREGLWIALFVGLALLRLAFWRSGVLSHEALFTPSSVRKKRRQLELLSLASGLSWGFFFAYFVLCASPAELVFISVCTIGTMAGAGLAYFRVPMAACLYCIPTIIIPFIALLTITDEGTWPILIMGVLFIFYVLFTARGAYRTFLVGVDVLEDQITTNAKLAAQYSVQSSLMRNMSHHARTPLHAVLGYSQILLQASSQSSNLSNKEYVKIIHDSGQELDQKISRYFWLSEKSNRSHADEINSEELETLLRRLLEIQKPLYSTGGRSFSLTNTVQAQCAVKSSYSSILVALDEMMRIVADLTVVGTEIECVLSANPSARVLYIDFQGTLASYAADNLKTSRLSLMQIGALSAQNVERDKDGNPTSSALLTLLARERSDGDDISAAEGHLRARIEIAQILFAQFNSHIQLAEFLNGDEYVRIEVPALFYDTAE